MNEEKLEWPSIDSALLKALELWIEKAYPKYQPQTTAESALHALIKHDGMRFVLAKLQKIAQNQVAVETKEQVRFNLKDKS